MTWRRVNEVISGDILTVTVEKLVEGGRGLARTEEGVIFVEGALPGERAVCRLVKRNKGYAEAQTVEILVPSPMRAQPFCPLYGECGGCDLQHLSPRFQAELKRDILQENLRRIGGIGMEKPIPAISGNDREYRIRARFHPASGEGGEPRLGFFRRKTRNPVALSRCPLLVPQLNRLIADPGEVLAKAEERGEAVIVAAAEPDRYAVGDEELSITLLAKQFRTRADLFFQANPPLFSRLLEDALAGLTGCCAADLYSGVGTAAAFLTERFTEVTAVELNPLCLRYARENLPSTVEIRAEAAERWLSEAEKRKGSRLDLLVVDPPRTGLTPEAVRSIMKIRPARLLYISCSSVTLSRDLKLLTGAYAIERIGAYDLYPHTSHLETAVVLSDVHPKDDGKA
jgi:23S rRNA (uracil1939-C5)-methyltransferase